jgi:hypothetical protein
VAFRKRDETAMSEKPTTLEELLGFPSAASLSSRPRCCDRKKKKQ